MGEFHQQDMAVLKIMAKKTIAPGRCGFFFLRSYGLYFFNGGDPIKRAFRPNLLVDSRRAVGAGLFHYTDPGFHQWFGITRNLAFFDLYVLCGNIRVQ